MSSTHHLTSIVNFIWTVADDVLVHAYKKGKYPDVILPMTVIRRLDLVLEPTQERVRATYEEYKDRLDNLQPLLTSAQFGSGVAFYNISRFTLKTLLADPKNLRANFENYLNGFSDNVQDIIAKFKFRNEVQYLDDAGILFSTLEKFVSPRVDLHPDRVSNHDMGYVYEDLIRRFSEENNEEAGEHFTPREIVRLMTHLLFRPVADRIRQGSYLIYDPCCGSGGMLTEAKRYLQDPDGLNSKALVGLYGQEIQPETYAVCKSDFLMKGENADHIAYGSTLTADGFSDLKFDFMLTNPPYGKSWKDDQKRLGVGPKGAIVDARFQVGQSRVNDGQLMFLLHLVSKMKTTPLGSRIASVHNGSALFTGDAGGGESEIRRHVLENDYLEAIIALPKDIFYNTGIATYIWVLTNRKEPRRQGKVQLINATELYDKMRKSLGSKRNYLTDAHLAEIERLYLTFAETDISRIFDNADFGYAQVTVHRPRRDASGQPVPLKKAKRVAPLFGEVKFESDPDLRDTENIPLKQDVDAFLAREVLPYAPDAWYDPAETRIGYEINFNKYFYRYQPPRPLSAIAADLLALERESEHLLKDILAP
jgi:type I restriction enzyme M protein